MITIITYSLLTNSQGVTPAQAAREKARKARAAELSQASFALKIGNAVVHRINFPKVLAGKVGRKASLEVRTRPLLSRWDEEEVRQTVALALFATGAMARERMTFGAWKVCFREARKAIGIDRNTKRGQSDTANPIDLMSEEEADFLTATTRQPYSEARKKAIARKVRYDLNLIRLAYALDASRKRAANKRKAIAVLRFLASQYSTTGKGMAEIVESSGDLADARFQTIKRFLAYIETAEAHLTAEAEAGKRGPVRVELKSFADAFNPRPSLSREIRLAMKAQGEAIPRAWNLEHVA